jgi:hypothetical protein
MGCIVVLGALFTPRFILVILWLFTDLVDRAFTGAIVPLLGLILLPYTTVFYVLAWAPGLSPHVSGFGVFLVIMGFLIDLSSYFGGAKYRTSRAV